MNPLPHLEYGWHHVIVANGFAITIVGMLLVFFSLSLISLVIKSTPYLLKILDRYFPEDEAETRKSSVKQVSETEVVAAISAALYHSMQSSKK
jgi:Na+-transporting methylmalonyl-CoA/oxaloacetate decarboxylase gamma subunit